MSQRKEWPMMVCNGQVVEDVNLMYECSARRHCLTLTRRLSQIIKSEVENNLNASFVIVGLVASLPQLNESIWLSFTRQTLFLRPNVKKLVYMKRVLASDRAAFEAQWNSSIMGYANGQVGLRTNDTEYSPILFETDDLSYLFFDPASFPILKTAIYHARDSGLFTLSPATGVNNVWGMGAYLAYYGAGNDTSSFSNNADRRQACQGYVATMLNVTEIFGRVLSRWAFREDIHASGSLGRYGFSCSFFFS